MFNESFCIVFNIINIILERGKMSFITDSLLGAFSNDLAIDLGTANTLVYVK